MTRYQIFCTSEMVCCDCVLIASFLPFFPTVRHFIFANHRPTCKSIPYFMEKVKSGEKKKRYFFQRRMSRCFSVIFPKKTGKTVISAENCEE